MFHPCLKEFYLFRVLDIMKTLLALQARMRIEPRKIPPVILTSKSHTNVCKHSQRPGYSSLYLANYTLPESACLSC